MPDLTNDQLVLALAVVAGIAILSFLTALISLLRLRKARREYMVLRGDGAERDILTTVDKVWRKTNSMNGRIDGVAARLEELSAVGRFALRRFDLIRYDAFPDMGGLLSFSAALLDDHGDGVVITSINGRSETRTYAKPVKGLESPQELTREERDVIDGAAAGHGRGGSRAPALR